MAVVNANDTMPPHEDTMVVTGGQRYSKHSQHWYNDGNAIFLVESQAFLLHRSILAMKSSVMADMLSLPQDTVPPSEQPMLGNHPVITMHDRAQDFADTLDFLYPVHIPPSSARPLPLTTLIGIVRISSKYLIEDLKAWAISELESIAPLTRDYEGEGGHIKHDVYRRPKDAIQVILLAREVHLPQFLPLAFYALATSEFTNEAAEDIVLLQSLTVEDQLRIKVGSVAMTRWLCTEGRKRPEHGCTEVRCDKCNWGKADFWGEPDCKWYQLILHPVEELGWRLGFTISGWICQESGEEFFRGTRELRQRFVERLVTFFNLG